MSLKLLITIAVTAFIAQTIKAVLHKLQYKKFNIWVYLEDGGMPSGHGVVLSALTTSVFYETGLSTIFAVTLVISFLFLGESMKVQRKPGIQSELMARFIDVREVIRRKLTEGTSHTPEQVFIGILIGIVIPSIVYAL